MEHLNRVVKDGMRTLSSNINKGVAVEFESAGKLCRKF